MTTAFAVHAHNPDLQQLFHLKPVDRTALLRSLFDTALAGHRAEVAQITASLDDATFDNTVLALERSGRLLGETARHFGVLAGTCVDDDIQALERDIGPRLSRHHSAIYQDAGLFARIDQVAKAAAGSPNLPAEAKRLTQRTHEAFLRAGAALAETERKRLAEIDAELSELGTRFSQNVLADERAWTLPLAGTDLDGLPAGLVSDLAANAEARGLTTGWLLTLSRSIVVPFLTYSARPDLRATAFDAWTSRGENDGPSDNRGLLATILRLRHERARLLGFESYAAFKLSDQMAGQPNTVRDLLTQVWKPARERVADDAAELRALSRSMGQNTELTPADWRYFAEARRRARLDFDEDVVKPYLSLDRMIEAAFDVAGRLFGLSFEEIPFEAWHQDVRAWRVLKPDGTLKGIFLGDYFARPTKRSGAWMSALRGQHGLDGGQTPIIYNVCNFAKPRSGEPALLGIDDARTLFHEFGHALHGLLSDVAYPSLAGTAVARDFVELPSQLFEHWLTVPDILRRHARHVRTGEPLPEALVAKLIKARSIDAGFDTVEYTASAIVDLDLHEAADPDMDPLERERRTLEAIGMPAEIVMRHRSPHFAHIFAGDGYASGYYSYLWSEVLDADAFEAFTEAGDPFDPATARRLHDHVYSAGDSADPAVLYEQFRGKAANPEALMRKRGFVTGLPGVLDDEVSPTA